MTKLTGSLGVRNEINVDIIGTGPRGLQGNDGYTPVRGTDYWTAADITVMESYINSYVNTVILGGAS